MSVFLARNALVGGSRVFIHTYIQIGASVYPPLRQVVKND